MPLVPGNGVTDAQREAIGKLTSDVGIACGMAYSELGSGAGGYMLARALTVDFGYSNAIAYQLNGANVDAAQTKKALVSNFDAGLPVAVSIDGAGGHEIVGDGYGYSGGTLYYHFNMGWGGNDDAWYAPPHLGTSNGAFNVLDGFVYNIYTDMQKDAVIASGRVVTSGGVPIVGATVTAKKNGVTVATKTTDARGIYALVLPAGVYSVTASKSGSTNSRSVSLSACVPLKLSDTFGSYSPSPTPSVGNECEQDIVLNGVASVAEPLISPVPSGGLFYPSVKVSITCSTSGAVIRYTLDGSEPTESSAVYAGPIFVDDTMTVRARAFKPGLNPSGVASMTYVYDASQGGPKGDSFANPMRISGASGSRTIEDMSQYTIETGEPTHSLSGGHYSYEFGSAWFAWTAPGSGAITFTVRCNGDSKRYPVLVAVYEGESLSLVKRLAMAKNYADNDYSSIVSLSVEQGKVYRIVGVTLYDLGGDAAEFVLSWSGDLEVETVDPFPTIGNLAETFGANSDVARYITTATKLADFNAFLRDCNVASAGEISSAQKPFVYQSFVLGSVLQTPVLLTREPELKVDSFVPNVSNAARWDMKVSLDAGQSVQMVAQKLAEAIRVGTDAKIITSPATVTAQSGEIGNPLTFTIAKPGEKSGFVKLLIAR